MLGIAQLINEASNHETNGDNEVALRLYKTAFNNLLDVNSQAVASVPLGHVSVSPFEVRSVADYINHRTCHLQFLVNHPRDSITQFKKHIDIFKQHTKSPEYAFEHSAWLSQQYIMFADLFNQAVTAGVKSSKTQHPGFYYYEAAMQMIERRRNITQYTNDIIRSNQMPVTNELLASITTPNFNSFLRQCGWTCVSPSDAPPIWPANSQNKPADELEKPINYSEIIIRALYKSIEYFEEWNRGRTQNYIGVIIADEYMLNNDLQRAQLLYNRSLARYEKERWTWLVESIKKKLSMIEKGLAGDVQE